MRYFLAVLLLSCWLPAAKAQNLPRLDQLDPSLIPIEERFPGQPKELVAILGCGRGRHWDALTCVAYRLSGLQPERLKQISPGQRPGFAKENECEP
jgi:hypothetical protein